MMAPRLPHRLALPALPKKLDEQLPRQWVEFVEAHLGLSSIFESAKQQMEGCRQSSKGSSHESNELEIAIQQEFASKYSESTDRVRHERKLK